MALGENKNPELTWSNIPDELIIGVFVTTQTFVLIGEF